MKKIWTNIYCFFYGLINAFVYSEKLQTILFWIIVIITAINVNITMLAIQEDCEVFDYEQQKEEVVTTDQSTVQLPY